MERKLRARQVFVAGGMPTVTYVERAALSLERSLQIEIEEGYKVVTVTGPTQSGKTVLTRHVLGSKKRVLINGGHVASAAEFWTLLVQELAAMAGDRGGVQSATCPVGAIPGPDCGPLKTSILKNMRAHDLALVIDDFHHLPVDVQAEIGRSLKSDVFEGLTAILIAVPRRTFNTIGMEREMEGRFVHVEIPPWGVPDLMAIPHQGFPRLNMDVDEAILRRFASEAHGNPLLVQRFCGRLCDHFEVEDRLAVPRSFRPSEAVLTQIFRAAGTQFRFTDLRRAPRRPQVALNLD